jgi:hypothetical protein
MVKVQKWEAQPQSILPGSIDGQNPPSNFINQANNLNGRIIDHNQPEDFVVRRLANQTACEVQHSDPAPRPAPGSCRTATFQPATIVQSVGYMKMTPMVCAISPELLVY